MLAMSLPALPLADCRHPSPPAAAAHRQREHVWHARSERAEGAGAAALAAAGCQGAACWRSIALSSQDAGQLCGNTASCTPAFSTALLVPQLLLCCAHCPAAQAKLQPVVSKALAGGVKRALAGPVRTAIARKPVVVGTAAVATLAGEGLGLHAWYGLLAAVQSLGAAA